MRPPALRPMNASDLAFAASLTLDEGWHSETLEEFEGFFAHDPVGCLVAEDGGERAGIGIATAYGNVGFLGEIVVAPAARGRGIGDAIVAALLAHLRAKGVTSVCLDATKAGAPLYERHGFRKDQPSLRYAGQVAGAAHPRVRPMRAQDLDAVCRLDREWWGADRAFFLARRLQRHPDLCRVLEQDGVIQGYVLARRRGDRLWIGPWGAAGHVDEPEVLLRALAPAGGGVQLHAGVLASSARAVEAFERLGLACGAEPPWRMVWGDAAALGRGACILANGTSAKG